MSEQVRRVRVRTPADTAPPTRTVNRGATSATAAVTVERAHRGKVYSTERKSHEDSRAPADLKGRVRIGGGITVNMGDFESIRVHVELELACENNVEGLQDTYDVLSPFLDELLLREKALATGEQVE